ncbi:hypothetical protein QR680_007046 [Steinernema hermaphroditum]|uniref:C3H1-type domain-containing protein n=1 Tax=Steinernema hermaphroditum TaxID=289476 RepID=A0AA39HZY2_9BILA|nr:hypothetical protein QR680_007046 [Steinernema hermaphroditum]
MWSGIEPEPAISYLFDVAQAQFEDFTTHFAPNFDMNEASKWEFNDVEPERPQQSTVVAPNPSQFFGSPQGDGYWQQMMQAQQSNLVTIQQAQMLHPGYLVQTAGHHRQWGAPFASAGTYSSMGQHSRRGQRAAPPQRHYGRRISRADSQSSSSRDPLSSSSSSSQGCKTPQISSAEIETKEGKFFLKCAHCKMDSPIADNVIQAILASPSAEQPSVAAVPTLPDTESISVIKEDVSPTHEVELKAFKETVEERPAEVSSEPAKEENKDADSGMKNEPAVEEESRSEEKSLENEVKEETHPEKKQAEADVETVLKVVEEKTCPDEQTVQFPTESRRTGRLRFVKAQLTEADEFPKARKEEEVAKPPANTRKENKRRPCHNFVRTGQCDYGNDCIFYHDYARHRGGSSTSQPKGRSSNREGQRGHRVWRRSTSDRQGPKSDTGSKKSEGGAE